jgi:hypothetical protein
MEQWLMGSWYNGEERIPMNAQETSDLSEHALHAVRDGTHDYPISNGAGAAALLASGVGIAFLGAFALCGGVCGNIAHFFNFYAPTGPLSGVTTSAIAIWLAVWFGLRRHWSGRSVRIAPVILATSTGFIVGLLLTFPPIMDAIQGK